MNVLLITADQFRGECLSAAGHAVVKTPHLDRLAEDGTRFTQHFGQCSPCGPSRASLLTGMYQMNHRSVQNGTPLDAGFTNLAQMVRTVGYTPWVIGYTDTSLDPRGLHSRDPRAGRYSEMLPGGAQFAPGSEDGSTDPAWLLHLQDLGYPNWKKPFRQKDGFAAETLARGPTFAPAEVKSEHGISAFTTDRALRCVRQYGDAPWFLHVSYHRPHPPLIATEPWHAMYDPKDVPDFQALASLDDERAIHPFMPFRLARLEMNPRLPLDGPHPNSNVQWRQARATYYGLVSELDDQIGRLLAGMKTLNAYDDTLIIFTSDHGEMLGDHWCWGKETPFDQAVHVPCIVRSPQASKAARGRVVNSFSEHVDIMPTVLDYIGAQIPLQCDGRSLREFAEGATPSSWRDEVHWEYDFRSISDDSVDKHFGLSIDELGLAVTRTKTQKYIHFSALPPLFYDVAADPFELENLAGEPARAEQILHMAQRTLSWRMAFNRRELTGIRLHRGQQIHAAAERRVLKGQALL